MDINVKSVNRTFKAAGGMFLTELLTSHLAAASSFGSSRKGTHAPKTSQAGDPAKQAMESSRLLTLVDDFGRYEADPQLLASECFPYGSPDGDAITCQQMIAACGQMSASNMVILYEIDGVKYLQLTRWKERSRAIESRFPAPLLTNDSKCPQMIASPSPSPSPPSPQPSPTPALDSGMNGIVIQMGKEERAAAFQITMTLKGAISVMMRRTQSQRWSYEDEHQLADIARRPDALAELEELKAFLARMKEKKFFPQSVSKLLETWDSTLDRARRPDDITEADQRAINKWIPSISAQYHENHD